MGKVYLVFGCHCHQPLGNFDEVVERIYQDSYLPFIETVNRHPKIKVVLHYSGVLLDWIKEKHTDFFDRLRGLVHRGQAELLSGSYYEAVLPVIPERDQIEQVKRMTGFIQTEFQTSPQGMWLAERVWEPKLAKTLPVAGLKFSLVDDFHFKAAGLQEAQLLGYFNVEEEGSLFSLFPINEFLRYSTPFQKVENTINYLRQISGIKENPILVIVDDGEKFGSWPGTKKWVYEDGWFEDFLQALEENSHWIETLFLSECLERFSPSGLVYLPIASYFEMGEWSLPAEQAVEYQNLVEKLKREGLLEKWKGFLQGGTWRNFFLKYPESNHLHKKMLALSNSIHRLGEKGKHTPQHIEHLENARSELLKSQCNDSYWHGVFGGLYLPHLRDALFRHLIQGEKYVDRIIHQGEEEWCDTEKVDFDGDGLEEIILSNPWLKAYFDPGEGGNMLELDYKPSNFNLVNTLARRFEHYHHALSTSLEKSSAQPPGEHTSIHDLDKSASIKELKDSLVYDTYRRACLIDHVFDKGIALSQFSSGHFSELGNFVNKTYDHTISKGKRSATLTLRRQGYVHQNNIFPLEIVKKIQMMYNQASLVIHYEIINRSDTLLEMAFGVEFNLSLLAGQSPEVTLSFPGEEEKYMMATSGIKTGVHRVKVANAPKNLSLSMDVDRESTIWWFPVETISQSERGFDLTYQSTVIMPKWEINIAEGKQWTMRIEITIYFL